MAVDTLARALAAGKVPVSAYEMAVKAGYTGTEEQFAEDMGNSGTNATNAANAASAAEASAATASAAAGNFAPAYSSSATYAVGDHVLYDGGYYVCNTAITTAEAWTAAHWTAAKVGPEITDLKTQIILNDNFKTALENLVNKVAYIGNDPAGYYYVNRLLESMYPVQSEYMGGYSVGKDTTTNVCYKNATTARACMTVPIKNHNYIFHSADTTKYQLNCQAIVNDTPIPNVPPYYGEGYQSNNRMVVWSDTDSVTTDYVWVSFKKLDGTDFTDEELANIEGTVFTWEIDKHEGIFPQVTYSSNMAISKSTQTQVCYKLPTSARACISEPIQNDNYIFRSVDSTKYQIACYDILNLTPIPPYGSYVGDGYQAGNKAVAWTDADSVTSDYVWIAFKKLDGTDFTQNELDNMVGTVFTWE